MRLEKPLTQEVSWRFGRPVIDASIRCSHACASRHHRYPGSQYRLDAGLRGGAEEQTGRKVFAADNGPLLRE